MKLPWSERVPMLSVNPDAATQEDVARLAASRMDTYQAVKIAVKNEFHCDDGRAHIVAMSVCGQIDRGVRV